MTHNLIIPTFVITLLVQGLDVTGGGGGTAGAAGTGGGGGTAGAAGTGGTRCRPRHPGSPCIGHGIWMYLPAMTETHK